MASFMKQFVPTEPVRVKVKSVLEEKELIKDYAVLEEREGSCMQIIQLHSFKEPIHYRAKEFQCIDETTEAFNAEGIVLHNDQGENVEKSLKAYLEFAASKLCLVQKFSLLDSNTKCLPDDSGPNLNQLENSLAPNRTESCLNEWEKSFVLNETCLNVSTGASSAQQSLLQDSAYETLNQTDNESIRTLIVDSN